MSDAGPTMIVHNSSSLIRYSLLSLLLPLSFSLLARERHIVFGHSVSQDDLVLDSHSVWQVRVGTTALLVHTSSVRRRGPLIPSMGRRSWDVQFLSVVHRWRVLACTTVQPVHTCLAVDRRSLGYSDFSRYPGVRVLSVVHR